MIYRKLSVHEVHRHGEETCSKKVGLEEIILDPPKPEEQATQQEILLPKFILLSQLLAMSFEGLALLQKLVAIMCVLCE